MATVFEEYFNTPEKLAEQLDVAIYACESARRNLPPNQNMCRICKLAPFCGLTKEDMIEYLKSEGDK